MKKALVLVVALAVLTVCSNGVSAQEKGNFWMSVPVSAVVPTGDLSDISETGWGTAFGIGYWVTEAIVVDLQFTYHNFGEKKFTVGDQTEKVNGAIFPIEVALAYYFNKGSKFRPYATIRTGSYSLQKDFRGELGQKTKPGNSGAIGLAYCYNDVEGESITGMLFVEPNLYVVYGDETYKYWTINFGVTWSIGE